MLTVCWHVPNRQHFYIQVNITCSWFIVFVCWREMCSVKTAQFCVFLELCKNIKRCKTVLVLYIRVKNVKGKLKKNSIQMRFFNHNVPKQPIKIMLWFSICLCEWKKDFCSLVCSFLEIHTKKHSKRLHILSKQFNQFYMPTLSPIVKV